MKSAGRPYRSHKYPACTRCHKRRSRCTIELPGQPCLLCRMHGVSCSSASSKKEDHSFHRAAPTRRSILSGKGIEQLAHVVGPVIARDHQILERYLPEVADQHTHGYLKPSGDSHGSENPIYHAVVPPGRASPMGCPCSMNLPAELLDLVEPFVDKLVRLFFEEVNPCFPMIEESCIVSRIGDRSSLPQTLLVNLHAMALYYWDLCPSLAPYARPDQDFAWQAAIAASQKDLHKSDLSTIISAALNVSGRPSLDAVHNIMSVSRMVALSLSIGLNHDPSKWKLGEQEKMVRLKTFWAVVVHDRWFNFAQGTPPLLTKGHYDVPIPYKDLLTTGHSNSLKHVRAAECWIALCQLTEIIGDILPLIYHIRAGDDGLTTQRVSQSEMKLDIWVSALPIWLQIHNFEIRPAVPGLVNLQLSYLSVRMLLKRMGWHEISRRNPDPPSQWLLGCQAAAEDIVRFATALHSIDLRSFWLPYNAQHFTSAVTLLLRCALQTSSLETRTSCMESAKSLVTFLRLAKEQNKWDLAETSLPQSEAFLQRIEEALPKAPIFHPKNKSAFDTPMNGQSNDQANETVLNETMQPDDSANLWHMSIEELFPDIFSDFTDTALLEGPAFAD